MLNRSGSYDSGPEQAVRSADASRPMHYGGLTPSTTAGAYALELDRASATGEAPGSVPNRSIESPWYARATLPRRVGVVIPTRNRADWLPHMLGSLMIQTHRPDRILVVDDGDGPGDGNGDGHRASAEVARRYPGVEYLRAPVGCGLSGNPARNVGLDRLAELPYLCFLDDDDMIPPDYLEILLDSIETDCRAAAAYPRLRFVGEDQGRWSVPYDPDLIARMNISGVPALIRTDAIRQVGGWPVFPPDPSGSVPHDDWPLWRRFRDLGWRMVPAPVDYYYYRHDSGICRTRARLERPEDWRRAVDPTDLVTLAIPWSGRGHLIEEVLDAVARQTYPASALHLLFYDNSGSESVGRLLKQWLMEHDEYAGVSYYRDSRTAVAGLSSRELADSPTDPRQLGHRRFGRELNDRVAALWNRIGQLVRTDLVWCLEDDVIPPPGTLDRLLDLMNPHVDGVTASYESRVVPGCRVAWRYTDLEVGELVHLPGGSGVEAIGGSGLGCALVRREVFRSGPARSAGDSVGYDCNLWLDVARRGGTLLMDWDLCCEHRFSPVDSPEDDEASPVASGDRGSVA